MGFPHSAPCLFFARLTNHWHIEIRHKLTPARRKSPAHLPGAVAYLSFPANRDVVASRLFFSLTVGI